MLAAVVVSVFAAVATAAETPPPDIARLVEQLGSDDYEVREEATKALAKLGPAAIPFLEAAANGDNPEAARRAASLIPRIRLAADSQTLLKPRIVRLAYKNVPLVFAVADLRERTELPLVLDPESVGDMLRPVTCETSELPVWEALAAFCKAAGLRESFTLELEAPKPPANRTYYFTPVRPDAGRVPINLIDGKEHELPGSRSRAVRVLALPASFPGHRVMLGKGQVEFCLDITPQSGLIWQANPAVRITRVVDDEGRTGGAGSPTPAPRLEPLPPNWNGPRMAQFDNSGSPLPAAFLPNPRVVRVPLRIATPSAKSLRVLEGSVIGEVLVPGQTLASISDPSNFINRTITGPNNLRVTVLGIETAADHVRVRVQSTAPSPWLARLRNNGPGPLWPEPPRTEGMTNQWKAFDAAGSPIPASSSDLLDIRDDGVTLTCIHQFNYPRDRGVPARMCLVGPRTVVVELPFKLEHVPLP
jgi:hypothetical protein